MLANMQRSEELTAIPQILSNAPSGMPICL